MGHPIDRDPAERPVHPGIHDVTQLAGERPHLEAVGLLHCDHATSIQRSSRASRAVRLTVQSAITSSGSLPRTNRTQPCSRSPNRRTTYSRASSTAVMAAMASCSPLTNVSSPPSHTELTSQSSVFSARIACRIPALSDDGALMFPPQMLVV